MKRGRGHRGHRDTGAGKGFVAWKLRKTRSSNKNVFSNNAVDPSGPGTGTAWKALYSQSSSHAKTRRRGVDAASMRRNTHRVERGRGVA